MQAYLCETCGVQHSPTSAAPERCPICQDERQYKNWRGQTWIILLMQSGSCGLTPR